MKYLGCAYHPEYWGPERTETDACLMQDAGINVVRIGEFIWTRMEPREGAFDLGWLHDCVEKLATHGIDVILCTPTAASPAWLTFAYPDTLLVRPDGRRREHGNRRHYCYTSRTYRSHAARIVERLSHEFSEHHNVIAWQIDNEADFGEGGYCYCEGCQAEFQAWLRARYGSVQELNQRWGTVFWSMDYTDWRQVRLGDRAERHPPSRVLDTRRFASDALRDFVLRQRDIIKRNHPDAVVSTNLNGSVFTDVDFTRLYDTMDVAMKDLYFDICTMDTNAMILDQFRSFKPGQRFWITETGAGMCGTGRPSGAEQFKAWMWSSFAHGCDAYVVFLWRSCLSGQEQEIEGMLEHSGLPGHRYRKVKEAFHEIRDLAPKLGDLPLPKAVVAIVHDYDVMWTYASVPDRSEIDYVDLVRTLYRQLYTRQVRADIIYGANDLEGYRLVILPSLSIVDADLARKLGDFVAQGGVVLAHGQIGMRDRNGNYLSTPAPDHLQDTLGVRINGGMYLYSMVEVDESWAHRRDFTVGVSGRLGKADVAGKAAVWTGDVELNGGQAEMVFDVDQYAGQPAVVSKATGSGVAFYAAAASLDDGVLSAVFDTVLSRAGVDFQRGIPEHVEVIRRGDATFVINHRNESVDVTIAPAGAPLKGTIEQGAIHLRPYGVAIFKGSEQVAP